MAPTSPAKICKITHSDPNQNKKQRQMRRSRLAAAAELARRPCGCDLGALVDASLTGAPLPSPPSLNSPLILILSPLPPSLHPSIHPQDSWSLLTCFHFILAFFFSLYLFVSIFLRWYQIMKKGQRRWFVSVEPDLWHLEVAHIYTGWKMKKWSGTSRVYHEDCRMFCRIYRGDMKWMDRQRGLCCRKRYNKIAVFLLIISKKEKRFSTYSCP